MSLRNLLYRQFCRYFAADLLRDAYCSVLGREPDADGLAQYRRNLARNGHPEREIHHLVVSRESWNRQVRLNADMLIGVVFEGLFGRPPTAAEMAEYLEELLITGDLAAVVADLRSHLPARD